MAKLLQQQQEKVIKICILPFLVLNNIKTPHLWFRVLDFIELIVYGFSDNGKN